MWLGKGFKVGGEKGGEVTTHKEWLREGGGAGALPVQPCGLPEQFLGVTSLPVPQVMRGGQTWSPLAPVYSWARMAASTAMRVASSTESCHSGCATCESDRGGHFHFPSLLTRESSLRCQIPQAKRPTVLKR